MERKLFYLNQSKDCIETMEKAIKILIEQNELDKHSIETAKDVIKNTKEKLKQMEIQLKNLKEIELKEFWLTTLKLKDFYTSKVGVWFIKNNG